MFLLGGPCFSGKTLLALLLNQGTVTCLDEPDFHNPQQNHRGIPVLRSVFPDTAFPAQPDRPLTHEESVHLIEECERAIQPRTLGVKTSDWTFIEYARVYKRLQYPVLAIVRDIRDVLTEAPVPEWVKGDAGVIERYDLIWRHRKLFDLVLRYEELVLEPQASFARISRLLGHEVRPLDAWPQESVHPTMVKLERHEMLKHGSVVRSQIGIWRSASRPFSQNIWATAITMGY